MAINITRWTPDTCTPPGCVIEFAWDDSVPIGSRVHTPANIVSKCPAHAAVGTLATLWGTLTEENPRKNKILNWVLANTPFTLANLSWSFDASRVLTITVVGLTPAQQTIGQNWADSHLGVGKVILLQG